MKKFLFYSFIFLACNAHTKAQTNEALATTSPTQGSQLDHEVSSILSFLLEKREKDQTTNVVIDDAFRRFIEEKTKVFKGFAQIDFSNLKNPDQLFEKMHDINHEFNRLDENLLRINNLLNPLEIKNNITGIPAFQQLRRAFDPITKKVERQIKVKHFSQDYKGLKFNTQRPELIAQFHKEYGQQAALMKTWGDPKNKVWVVLFVSPFDAVSRVLVKSVLPRLLAYLEKNPQKLYVALVDHSQADHWAASQKLWEKDNFYDAFFKEDLRKDASLSAGNANIQEREAHLKKAPAIVSPQPGSFFVITEKKGPLSYHAKIKGVAGPRPGTLFSMIKDEVGFDKTLFDMY